MQSAGNRDQRITIERKAGTRNTYGEVIVSWSTLATVWAEARPVRGSEFLASGQTQARADVMFRIVYRSDLTELDRVVWRGEYYAIVAPPVDVQGAKEVIELYCLRGGRDGL
jgi:SPP1 family predicted phage head-tail adaptor